MGEAAHSFSEPMADTKVLVMGGVTGWIGQMVMKELESQNIPCVASRTRMENRESLSAELDAEKPTHVINCAGVTGRPNVDWCESNKQAAVRTNIIGALNAADLCDLKGIHHTLCATGCIFEYDETHQMGDGNGFKEEDKANFSESWYSETKGYLEPMLRGFPTTLVLRLRMPISDDLNHRNFVTKILKYARVVNIPNSMTVLTEFIPAIIKLSMAKKTGTLNFTNPGVISHNQVLDMYIEEVDPGYSYTNFTLEEQAKVLAAGRSNNELDTTKLMEWMQELGHEILPILDSVRGVMKRMKVNLIAEHGENYLEHLPRHDK